MEEKKLQTANQLKKEIDFEIHIIKVLSGYKPGEFAKCDVNAKLMVAIGDEKIGYDYLDALVDRDLIMVLLERHEAHLSKLKDQFKML